MNTDYNYGYYNEDEDDYIMQDKKKYTHTMTVYKENDEGEVKPRSSTVYSSDFMGGKILHAMTGDQIGVVGKHDQGLFKVSMTCGLRPGLNSNPAHLYYFGPDEYERHHHVVLSDNVKEKWYQNRIQQEYSVV
jgi:hypothetical protein